MAIMNLVEEGRYDFMAALRDSSSLKNFAGLVLKMEINEKCFVDESPCDLEKLPSLRLGNHAYIHKMQITDPILRMEVEHRCTDLQFHYPVSLMINDFGITPGNVKALRKSGDVKLIGPVAFIEYPESIRQFIRSYPNDYVVNILDEDEDDEGYECTAQLSVKLPLRLGAYV